MSRTIELGQGRLVLFEDFLEPASSYALQQWLIDNAPWRHESIKLFGKTHRQPRLTAWYGFGMSASSRYTRPLEKEPWPRNIAEVKRRIEEETGSSFNSVLCNFYRNGLDGIGMHADDEACWGDTPKIASLSLGASRRFVLTSRGYPRRNRELILENGSLLLMDGAIQKYWLHGIPKTKKKVGPRVNLTFRLLIHESTSGNC